MVLYDDATVRSKRPEGQARAAAPGPGARQHRVKHIEDEPDHGKAIAGALDAIATGDFVLLQSDEAFSGPPSIWSAAGSSNTDTTPRAP